jgi:hypothetical protein
MNPLEQFKLLVRLLYRIVRSQRNIRVPLRRGDTPRDTELDDLKRFSSKVASAKSSHVSATVGHIIVRR